MPSREGFIFMLQQGPDGQSITPNRAQEGYWDAYVWIHDADALYAEYKERGAVIDYAPCIRAEYDMKEFAVVDPDGYVLAFGQHHEA